jgi:hypothetical protein
VFKLFLFVSDSFVRLQVTAGLRQLAVRAILRHALFPSGRAPERTLGLINQICERRGFTTFRMLVPPSFISVSGRKISFPDPDPLVRGIDSGTFEGTRCVRKQMRRAIKLKKGSF